MPQKTTWISVIIKVETDQAILVDAGMEEDAWIPKSQIIDSSEDIRVGTSMEIEIPGWMAEKKELV